MRIALASRIFEPESGAAAYRLGAMVRELRACGHDVTIFTSHAPGSPSSSRQVRRWPVLRDRSGAVRGYLQYASFDMPLFFRLLLAPRYDILIVEPPPTTGVVVRIVSWLKRYPYLYFAADVSSVAAEGIGVNAAVVRVLRGVERWVLRGARGVLSVSGGVSSEVRELAGRDTPIHEVGTGIDTELFTMEGPRADVGQKTFVYAGTMSEIQGAGVFVEAFMKIHLNHPDAALLMYGQGVEEEHLKAVAAGAGDRVQFGGNVAGETVAAALRTALAGLASVRPSRGYDFAFATKALVSLSCGAPVLYAGVGPLREVINENELGWTVDWNSDEVAAAMEMILEEGFEDSRRAELSAWASANYSLAAVGRSAAEAVSQYVG
ncbi:glycosyltransferase [Vibrio cholerae]|nr:glycosyltransferase [Vibrio cholerae]